MQTHPTESPVAAKTMLVPPVVATLVIYGVLILVGSLPNLFLGETWLLHFWVTIPLGLVAYATPVALFFAVFAINEKRAILVPIGGVFVAAMLEHYMRLSTAGDVDVSFQQEFLRRDLWDAIKYALPPALLVSGLAMFAARWWAPRCDEDPGRFVIPPIKPALILFVVSVGISLFLSYEISRGTLTQYPGRVTEATFASFSIIAMCFLCAVALKPWTALLPLALVAETFALSFFQPSACDPGWLDGDSCWNLYWPYIRTQIFAFAVLFVLSVLAGAWGRDEEDAALDPELEPESQSG